MPIVSQSIDLAEITEERYNEDKNKRPDFRARKHRNQDCCKIWKWGCNPLHQKIHRKRSLCDLEGKMQD